MGQICVMLHVFLLLCLLYNCAQANVFSGGVKSLNKQCIMTQDCLESGDVPCIPKAKTAAPKPMKGEGWYDVIGGGKCLNDDECNQGNCDTNGKCQCVQNGIVGGAYCNGTAIQCPEYRDAACCSWQQNIHMAQNFMLIVSTFGNNKHGGCAACAANMMQMWCGLVCSPYQAEFLSLHSDPPSTAIKPDPLNDGALTTVLELDVVLAKELTCSLFDSCKDTSIASQAEAMKSSLGFLKYQAQTGAISHGEYIHIHFGDEKDSFLHTPFTHRMLECSNYSWAQNELVRAKLPSQASVLPSINSQKENASCPCSACKKSCEDIEIHYLNHPISVFTGFDWKLVSIAYTAIAILTAIFWWKSAKK